MAKAWRAMAVGLLGLGLALPAVAAQGRLALGANPPGRCAEAGCSYVDGQGACILSADGAGGLVAVVNGQQVKLKRLEQRPVLRKNPRIPNAPGNKMLSRYESVESAIGNVQVQVLDTVVRVHGKCRRDRDGCEAVDYASRIQIQVPRRSITIGGRGWCND